MARARECPYCEIELLHEIWEYETYWYCPNCDYREYDEHNEWGDELCLSSSSQ